MVASPSASPAEKAAATKEVKQMKREEIKKAEERSAVMAASPSASPEEKAAAKEEVKQMRLEFQMPKASTSSSGGGGTTSADRFAELAEINEAEAARNAIDEAIAKKNAAAEKTRLAKIHLAKIQAQRGLGGESGDIDVMEATEEQKQQLTAAKASLTSMRQQQAAFQSAQESLLLAQETAVQQLQQRLGLNVAESDPFGADASSTHRKELNEVCRRSLLCLRSFIRMYCD